MKYLRDLSVSIIGVLIAAMISLWSVFYYYDRINIKQCNSILEMVVEENRLNEVHCKNILERLNDFVASGKTVEVKLFTIRILSNANSIASNSNLLIRYVPKDLRSSIYVHCENVRGFNANLDNFNDYLKSHIDDPECNLIFMKKWASILIEGTNYRSEDSKNLTLKLTEYLNEN